MAGGGLRKVQELAQTVLNCRAIHAIHSKRRRSGPRWRRTFGLTIAGDPAQVSSRSGWTATLDIRCHHGSLRILPKTSCRSLRRHVMRGCARRFGVMATRGDAPLCSVPGPSTRRWKRGTQSEDDGASVVARAWGRADPVISGPTAASGVISFCRCAPVLDLRFTRRRLVLPLDHRRADPLPRLMSLAKLDSASDAILSNTSPSGCFPARC